MLDASLGQNLGYERGETFICSQPVTINRLRMGEDSGDCTLPLSTQTRW